MSLFSKLIDTLSIKETNILFSKNPRVFVCGPISEFNIKYKRLYEGPFREPRTHFDCHCTFITLFSVDYIHQDDNR